MSSEHNPVSGSRRNRGHRSLGMHHPLGYAFTVELLHLLDDVVVVQRDRSARPEGQRVLVARAGIPESVMVVGALASVMAASPGTTSGRAWACSFSDGSPCLVRKRVDRSCVVPHRRWVQQLVHRAPTGVSFRPAVSSD